MSRDRRKKGRQPVIDTVDLGYDDDPSVATAASETTMPAGRPTLAVGPACLVEVYGDQVGRRLDLESGVQVLGRVPESDIVVAHPSVSRQHARITYAPSGYTVTDLGSTNGTFVDDNPVREGPLYHGCFLKVGTAVFRLLATTDLDEAYAAEVRRMSRLDGLTRTMRRRAFCEVVDAWVDCQLPVAVVLLVIDRFDELRDRFGDLAAQNVLSLVASVLRKRSRSTDVIGLVGDSAFALLLTDLDSVSAKDVADKLRRHVALSSFRYADTTVPIYLRASVAMAGGSGSRGDHLLARAAKDLDVELDLR